MTFLFIVIERRSLNTQTHCDRYFKLCKIALKLQIVVVIVVVAVVAECIIKIDSGQQIKVKEY